MTAAGAAAFAVSSRTAWARTFDGDGGDVRGGSRDTDPHGRILLDAAMKWRRLPSGWQSAPFFGNGFLAAHLYSKAGEGNALRIMLNHSLVQDQRGQWEAAIGYSRLPVGYLTLTFTGTVTDIDWSLDPATAELNGTVTTTAGGARMRVLILRQSDVLLVSLEPTAGERNAAWGFTALPSATTRTTRVPPEYTANPDPAAGPGFVEQPLDAGGGYTTAWREIHEGTRRLLAAGIAYGFPDSTGRERALSAVNRALTTSPDALVREHRRWWGDFYRRSLVSVPDKHLQRFYWIQLYKMASSTGKDSPVLPVFGPWFPETGNNWTNIWWNLNTQVAYPLINGSNHLELDAITPTFRTYHRNLELNIHPAHRDGESYALCHPGDRELRPGPRYVGVPGVSPNDHTGNLTWAMHNVWLSYRHSMDRRILQDVLYPVLSRAIAYYARFLAEGSDGLLHLPETRSPEYANASDCTYDLSLIRWGCRTLLETARALRIDEAPTGRLRDILTRLVPYHRGEQGVLIGAEVPLAESHRHYSHLLWLYPLQESLDRTSFEHWAGMRERWHGYSFAAAASMETLFGNADRALSYLKFFTDGNTVDGTQLTPNTMYREGSNFAIESPLAAAQSLLDMLVQSHGGTVRVFPAIPPGWADASVQRLRTQGAFLVDASRSAGRTDWVTVRSEAGAPLVLEHGIDGAIDVRDERGRKLPYRGTGTITVDLPKGRTAVVTRRGSNPVLRPRDVPADGTYPRWGLPEPN
ncbi:glycosyl hydrolase family 95 catalytic domain-containing protein [Streptomyces scopuliridis]|uniref:glycosyl hydrolase family 95 catalytic domain-containing protein n=1 Tax=Streptomyces scopuliridis TaxID=452529 RepID=UPI0035D80965